MIKFPEIVMKDGRTLRPMINEIRQRVQYFDHVKIKRGEIFLDDGWQDSDRTYTSQDIYWCDKYDCHAELRRAQYLGVCIQLKEITIADLN